jgi:serine/threonine protein kinase
MMSVVTVKSCVLIITGLVMEHIDGVDLQSYLTKQGGTLSEEVARFLFQQLTITVGTINAL